jgi:uncharacterized protein with HEPN domain
MQLKSKKYILDIQSAIDEIETVITFCEGDFAKFENNFLAIRTTERLLEIIGEALKKLLESDSTIVIGQSPRIISLRNRLAHAYDSIISSVIWSIIIKNIPQLKEEISKL